MNRGKSEERAAQGAEVALAWKYAGHIRLARWRVAFALAWKPDSAKALTAAATIWLVSGRFHRALSYAERASTRIDLGGYVPEDEHHRLSCEIAMVGGLASCHLRNNSNSAEERKLWTDEAVHWFKQLAQHSPETLREVIVPRPVLRDLHPLAARLAGPEARKP